MKGHEAGLRAKTNDRQQEQQIGRRLGNVTTEGRELQRSRLPAHQNEQHEQERRSQVRGDQVGAAGLQNSRRLVVKRDQKVGGDAHDLPGDEKQHAVGATATSVMLAAIRLKKNQGMPSDLCWR